MLSESSEGFAPPGARSTPYINLMNGVTGLVQRGISGPQKAPAIGHMADWRNYLYLGLQKCIPDYCNSIVYRVKNNGTLSVSY